MDVEWEAKVRERMGAGAAPAAQQHQQHQQHQQAQAQQRALPPAAGSQLRFADAGAGDGGGFLSGFGARAENRAQQLRSERAREYNEFLRNKMASEAEQKSSRRGGGIGGGGAIAYIQPPPNAAPGHEDHVASLLGSGGEGQGSLASTKQKSQYAIDLERQIADRAAAKQRQDDAARARSRELLQQRMGGEEAFPPPPLGGGAGGGNAWAPGGGRDQVGGWQQQQQQQQPPDMQQQMYRHVEPPQQQQQQQQYGAYAPHMQQAGQPQAGMHAQQQMQQPGGFPQPSMMVGMGPPQLTHQQQHMQQQPPPQQQYAPPPGAGTGGAVNSLGAYRGAPVHHSYARGGPVDPVTQAAMAREDAKKADYARVLQQQIQEKKDRDLARKKQERLADERKAREAANYNPWGRGGGGAPLKDDGGNVVTDLNDLKALQKAHNMGAGYTVDGMPADVQPGAYNRAVGPKGSDAPDYGGDGGGGYPPDGGQDYSQWQGQAEQQVPGGNAVGKFDRNDGLRDLYGYLTPEERNAKARRAEQIQRDLQDQIEEKRRRKKAEKERERAEEAREEERLRREQQKMREVFEREQERERQKRDAKLQLGQEPTPVVTHDPERDALEQKLREEEEARRRKHERLHRHRLQADGPRPHHKPPPYQQRVAEASGADYDEIPAVAGYRPPPEPEVPGRAADPPPLQPHPALQQPPPLNMAPDMRVGGMTDQLPMDERDPGDPKGFAQAAAAALPVDEIMGQIKAEFQAQQEAMRVAMTEQMEQVNVLRSQAMEAEAGAERAKIEAANLREALRDREHREKYGEDMLAAAAEMRSEMRMLPERLRDTIPFDAAAAAPEHEAREPERAPAERALASERPLPSDGHDGAVLQSGGLVNLAPLPTEPSEVDVNMTSRSLVAESTLIPVNRATTPPKKAATKGGALPPKVPAAKGSDGDARGTSAGSLGLGSLDLPPLGDSVKDAASVDARAQRDELPSGAQTPQSINLDLIHKRNLERLSNLEQLGKDREQDPDQLDELLKRFLNQSKMPAAAQVKHLSRPASAVGMEKSLVSESDWISKT